jgi:hypothetical protein
MRVSSMSHVHVFARRQRGEEIVLLKDEPDAAPHLDQLPRAQFAQLAARARGCCLPARERSAPISVSSVVFFPSRTVRS